MSPQWTDDDAAAMYAEAITTGMAAPDPLTPAYPCAGRCHHAEAPCSLGCWAAQKPWKAEAAALRTPAPAEPGLREALDAMERDLRFLVGDVHDMWATWERVRAALATTPDTLDVERLTQACINLGYSDEQPGGQYLFAGQHRMATRIAAEYARLREDRS